MLSQLPFEVGIFAYKSQLPLRAGQGLLLFLAPGIELRFVQTEFTGSSNPDTFRKFQGFVAKLRRVLLAGVLTV